MVPEPMILAASQNNLVVGVLCVSLTHTPKMRVTQTSRFPLYAISLDEHSNRYALLNIEDILIVRSIRSSLLFLAVAMKVEQINIVECFHKTLAHSAKRWIVQIAVVAD